MCSTACLGQRLEILLRGEAQLREWMSDREARLPHASTEQFAVILRQVAREKRRHSGAMSRLFAGELAEKRREVRSVAIFKDSP